MVDQGEALQEQHDSGQNLSKQDLLNLDAIRAALNEIGDADAYNAPRSFWEWVSTIRQA